MALSSTFSKIMPSGLVLDFTNPQPEMICLRDIVHVLSRISRWGGNIEAVSYSVAQHSLVTANACRLPQSRPYALLHDAAEAYIGDLPTPLKLWIADAGADIVGLEMRILFRAIFPALGIAPPGPEISADVHEADQVALATEYRDVVAGRNEAWSPKAKPLPNRIKFMTQPAAEEKFQLALEAALRPFGKVA